MIGWPQLAIGTFGGEVVFVDAADNGKGQFRVVVGPSDDIVDRGDGPVTVGWPDKDRWLRQGARANAWIMLNQVPLWFEIWRKINGFPPVITDEEEPFSDGQLAELLGAGLRVFVRDDLDEVLPELDAVYINAIAWTGEGKGYEELGVRYRLSAESPLKPGAIVLHPLARGTELDTSLDDTPHNWYFAQARGAVFVRMALLSAILKTFS